MTPTTDAGRLFTCVWAISGIAILGIALGVVGHDMIQAQITSLEEKKKNAEMKTMKAFGSTENEEKEEESFELPISLILRYVVIVAFLVGGATWFAIKEGWEWYQALYYFVITSATVGYGDLSPSTAGLRLFAVLYIIVAVAAMGEFLGAISSRIVESRQEQFYAHLMEHKFDFDDLQIMDTNHDNEVSELEFVLFMLKSMHKVDDELLKDLQDRFKEMDVTGDGTLSVDDLKKMHQK